MSGGDDDFARWADLHSRQLAAMGLPDAYWRMLHASVREQRFDAGAWVQFAVGAMQWSRGVQWVRSS